MKYYTLTRGIAIIALFVVATAIQAQPDADLPTEDVVFNDDLIVDGSACIGFDCVNGESFGFDTLRLKENNLRIKFLDTSTAASFPTWDWQLTANDSSNGGANKFSIDDITGGKTPFTIEGNAPSHSLFVDDGGRIGFGTNVPVVELHVVDGDTPTLRLEQDGSSGFTPQTWDVAGNETNFFIRDVTNGSQLPLRIRPGADSNSLYIDTDNDVGIGTSSPDARLHVDTNGGEDAFLVNNDGGTAAEELFIVKENGTVGIPNGNLGIGTNSPSLSAGGSTRFVEIEGLTNPGFLLHNTSGSGREFLFYSAATAGGTFRIFDANSSLDVFTINNIGRLEVFEDSPTKPNGGAWVGASDKRLKTAIKPYSDGLEQIMNVNPVNYQYNGKGGLKSNGKEYVGVIAQELEKVAPYMIGTYFTNNRNLKSNAEYLSVDPSAFVYMLINATKEQQEILNTQDERLTSLQNENDELRKMISELQSSFEEFKKGTQVELEGTSGAFLKQNTPNPFTGQTQIEYSIPANISSASIRVYNINGQLLKEVPITEKGHGFIDIEAKNLAQGSYTYSLFIDGQIVETKKMVLAR